MGCSSCSKNKEKSLLNLSKGVVEPVKNLIEAGSKQSKKLKWFRNGVTGIIKCIDGQTKYTDEQIQKNRQICQECEHSTKTDGKITLTSQCMAPNPDNNNVPCGCFILCKTQTDVCPIKKFTYLTIDGDSV